jgi:phosphopantetheinyl transferase
MMSGIPTFPSCGTFPVTLAFRNTDEGAAGPLEEPWEQLSAAEQTRAGRFHFERDRQRWIRGRAWVRQQLGATLGLPPRQVELAAEPGGRLYIPGAAIDFNLSHTGNWIALGICRGGRLGVDLETVDPAFPTLEIAREFFLPEEHDWIASGPIDRFFHLWTAKEALMKATGRGMSLQPDKIFVTTRDDQPATVTNLETGEVHSVTTWGGPGDTIAAVVLT